MFLLYVFEEKKIINIQKVIDMIKEIDIFYLLNLENLLYFSSLSKIKLRQDKYQLPLMTSKIIVKKGLIKGYVNATKRGAPLAKMDKKYRKKLMQAAEGKRTSELHNIAFKFLF